MCNWLNYVWTLFGFGGFIKTDNTAYPAWLWPELSWGVAKVLPHWAHLKWKWTFSCDKTNKSVSSYQFSFSECGPALWVSVPALCFVFIKCLVMHSIFISGNLIKTFILWKNKPVKQGLKMSTSGASLRYFGLPLFNINADIGHVTMLEILTR